MAEEQAEESYVHVYIQTHFFLMKYQNQRGRHVDRQTEGPKKREKNTSNYICFPLFQQLFQNILNSAKL